MNCSLPILDCCVKKEFLYDMDKSYAGQYEKCKIIGISSYLNETLTFSILTEQDGLYSYIPFHAIKKNKELTGEFELDELVYHNCNSLEIEVFKFEYLGKLTPKCFFKKKNMWMYAEYICSIDFYMGNDLLHIMWLENGQFCAMPSHKINWKGVENLPDYKKIHQTWKI